jgi:hypothetical protein
LNWWRTLWGFVFQLERLLKDAGLSREERGEFPVKATGTQKARPGNGNRDAERAPHKAGESSALQADGGQGAAVRPRAR